MSDSKCPKCGGDLGLYEAFVAHGYSMAFEEECRFCKTALLIDVEAEPIFHVTVDKKTNEIRERYERMPETEWFRDAHKDAPL